MSAPVCPSCGRKIRTLTGEELRDIIGIESLIDSNVAEWAWLREVTDEAWDAAALVLAPPVPDCAVR